MKIILLGINGSIGKTTLKVLSNFKNNWEIVGFSIGNDASNVDYLIKTYKPKAVSFKNEKDYFLYKNLYKDVLFFYGEESYLKLLDNLEYDILINALSGFSGFKPSINCLKQNKILLLANKESLVAGGEIINDILKTNGKLIPIDSEHVAIKKCLENEDIKNVKNIIITASGGPFFELDKAEFKNITKEKALNHPTRKMGQRITIDSSTMMNKCFELIEAYYLFNIDFSKIKVLVDRRSLIHGLVIFNDGRIKECKYTPTMENPIKYALDKAFNNELDLSDVYLVDKIDSNLLEMNYDKFPLINLSSLVIEKKGNSGAILNAIDEEAVKAFLNDKIKYTDIYKYICKIMYNCRYKKNVTINELIVSDRQARKAINYLIEKESK